MAAGVGIGVTAAYGAYKLGDFMIKREYQVAKSYGESYVQGLLATPNIKTANIKTANIASTALKTPSVKKALRI